MEQDRPLSTAMIVEPSKLQGAVWKDAISRRACERYNWCSTVDAAMQAVEREPPDLLITAMQLPDGRGIDLLQRALPAGATSETCLRRAEFQRFHDGRPGRRRPGREFAADVQENPSGRFCCESFTLPDRAQCPAGRWLRNLTRRSHGCGWSSMRRHSRFAGGNHSAFEPLGCGCDVASPGGSQ